jgi:hypothetical protein
MSVKSAFIFSIGLFVGVILTFYKLDPVFNQLIDLNKELLVMYSECVSGIEEIEESLFRASYQY